VKCNIDEARCPGFSTCGGNFRDHNANYVGGFSESFKSVGAFRDEIKCSMFIELDSSKD